MDQAKILRKMTGEQRLEQAFELSDLTRDLAIINIKEQLGKKASKKKVMEMLKRRLNLKNYLSS